LTWPEMVRTRVEQDYASVVPLAKRWLTLRYVLRKKAFQVYLDDRLLQERHGIDTDGLIRLTLYEGVQLASVRVRSLPDEDSRFETVQLGSYLNASRMRGETFRRGALPQSGKATAVGGVPFLLPPPDEHGHDHIDLKPSWLSCGSL